MPRRRPRDTVLRSPSTTPDEESSIDAASGTGGPPRSRPLNPVPEAVRRLIADAIDSIAELEAILLLRSDPGREWSPADAGSRLYVSVPVATYLLAVLAERGFLAAGERGYRYAPRTPELAEQVSMLAAVYSSSLIAVTNLVHAKPAPSVRQFAEAFRLRKDG